MDSVANGQQKSPHEARFTAASFLVLLLIILGVVVYMKVNNSNLYPPPGSLITNQSSPSAIQVTSTSQVSKRSKLEAPALFNALTWQRNASSTNFPKALIVTNRKTGAAEEMLPRGQLWSASQTGISDPGKLGKAAKDIVNYYESLLTKKGWTYEVSLENYQLKAKRMNDASMNIMGLIGYENGQIRLLSLVTKSIYATSTAKSGNKCPCIVEAQLFLSDILPVESVTKK